MMVFVNRGLKVPAVQEFIFQGIFFLHQTPVQPPGEYFETPYWFKCSQVLCDASRVSEVVMDYLIWYKNFQNN